MIAQDRSARHEGPSGSVPTMLPVERVFSYADALGRYWKVVAVVTVVATSAALLLSLLSTKQYDATSKVLVGDAEPINIVTQSASRSQDPERDLNTGIELAKLNVPAQRALARVGRPMSVAALLARTEVGPEGNSNVVSIKVRDPSPALAPVLANAFAEEYVRFRRESARAPYRNAADLARARLRVLGDGEDSDAERQALTRRINELEVASTVQTGGAQLINRASPPTGPAAPRTRLNVLAGLIAGLFFGCVLAFLLDRWHPRLVGQIRAARTNLTRARADRPQ
jgi:polysaccharide biosynthesis transport protein